MPVDSLIYWGHTICMELDIDFDPTKDVLNRAKHGISLADAVQFEWATAQIEEDTRIDYGERRFQATGYIGIRLHRMIFCRRGEKTRIISLRKANPREMKHYAST